ncbi:flagellar basal body-associated FliL family protein [Rhodocista pekingensis]|uniref:Flagellar basal body-associated FliL family protein n=1 Tax=Rhodocista pekingensis TaxID=201185 RepID=A0ABW2KTN2_9PROT
MRTHRFLLSLARPVLLAFALAVLLSGALPAGTALASGGGGGGEVSRNIRLTPFSLPGKDRFSYVQLVAELVVREGDEAAVEVQQVQNLRPRIIGRLTEALSSERFMSRSVSAAEVLHLKERLRELVNDAIGTPMVEDVLIVSLVLS